MPINEIEVPGTSINFRIFKTGPMNFRAVVKKMLAEEEQFSVEPENPGYHDIDFNAHGIRGYYSLVEPFEVEHLVDGIMTKTLLKKVESCEFHITREAVYVTGKTGPQKIFERSLAGLSGYGTSGVEFDFHELQQLQERLALVKGISLTNPRTHDVRKVKLSGKIESYTDCNVIDTRNHFIESVQGTVETPLGPMTITVGRRGTIRLGVRRGFILTTDVLDWIMKLIQKDQVPDNVLPDHANEDEDNEGEESLREGLANLKKQGVTVTVVNGSLGKTILPTQKTQDGGPS
jgi:hypothetical protein